MDVRMDLVAARCRVILEISGGTQLHRFRLRTGKGAVESDNYTILTSRRMVPLKCVYYFTSVFSFHHPKCRIHKNRYNYTVPSVLV